MVRIPSFQPRIAFVSAWIKNQLHHSRKKIREIFFWRHSRVIRIRIIFFVRISCLVFHCPKPHLRPSSLCLSCSLSLKVMMIITQWLNGNLAFGYLLWMSVGSHKILICKRIMADNWWQVMQQKVRHCWTVWGTRYSENLHVRSS